MVPDLKVKVAGSALYSDDLKSYERLQAEYPQGYYHAVQYVDGSYQNFGSLFMS